VRAVGRESILLAEIVADGFADCRLGVPATDQSAGKHQETFMKLFFATVAAGLLLVSATASALTAQGTVQYVYTYGDGSILVTGFTFSGAPCGNNGGFFIAGTHPNRSQILAQVLAAKAQGTTLEISAFVAAGCWYPQITLESSTYVVAFPQ
jgi:hypothetical protein